MNKKLLSVVLSATCVIALAACGGSNDATILADADHATYCVVGPSQTTIGGESIAWDYSEAGVMTASSRNDLKEVSEDLYDDLKSVKLSSLYILKDVVVGAEAAGYNKTAMLDGGLVQADGALTLKTASINYDAVDDVYSIDEWLVSPEHYGETLTPDTYWVSPHYETPDENGHSHASDPVVVAGAGTYTVVLARYTNIKEDGSKVGIGLVQQSANAEGQQVTPIVPVDLTSLGAIGSFAASESWNVEAALTKNEEDVWEGDVEAVAGNEFKIRANGAWTYSWGFAAVTEAAAGIISDVGGNIGAVADGTYHISIVAPAQLSLISQDLTSFEITFEPAAVDPEPQLVNPIVLTGAKLGLTAAYADVASVAVDNVDMGVYQCGDYGDGIQMRYKNAKQSSFFNIEAAPYPIVSIVILHTAAKYPTYAPTLLDFYAGTSSQQAATTGAEQPVTEAGVFSYEVTFEASENITFFKIEKPALDYSAYLTSVTITMEVPTE